MARLESEARRGCCRASPYGWVVVPRLVRIIARQVFGVAVGERGVAAAVVRAARLLALAVMAVGEQVALAAHRRLPRPATVVDRAGALVDQQDLRTRVAHLPDAQRRVRPEPADVLVDRVAELVPQRRP